MSVRVRHVYMCYVQVQRWRGCQQAGAGEGGGGAAEAGPSLHTGQAGAEAAQEELQRQQTAAAAGHTTPAALGGQVAGSRGHAAPAA